MPFKEGNKDAEKWTEEKSLEIFKSAFNWVKENKEVLSMHDVYLYAYEEYSLPRSTFKYLVNKYNVLATIKEMIQSLIVSRINKQALKNDFNTTASIWRMKQLGERDPDKQEGFDIFKNLKFTIKQS